MLRLDFSGEKFISEPCRFRTGLRISPHEQTNIDDDHSFFDLMKRINVQDGSFRKTLYIILDQKFVLPPIEITAKQIFISIGRTACQFIEILQIIRVDMEG